LLGLPFGGASYGLVCDPDELSERELLRLFTCAAQRLRFPAGKAKRSFFLAAAAGVSA